MAYQSFIYELTEGIATVRLHNPDKLNALTFQTYEELERLFADLAHGEKPAQLPLAVGLDTSAIDLDISPPPQDRRNNFQQSRFTRTVGTEDTDHLASLDGQGHAVEHGPIFVSKRQVVGLNRRIHKASFLAPSR